ncbi:MAG: hypothetical protein QG575_593, partial [Euryarchaeota archaeon]|nr:hypothetical protein [Euryarchaeota archaeon]
KILLITGYFIFGYVVDGYLIVPIVRAMMLLFQEPPESQQANHE